jgi:hypothetical protein
MAACLYGADGTFSCPLRFDGHDSSREGFFAAFAGPFDAPQKYIPDDLSAAMSAQGAAAIAQTASEASIAQVKTSSGVATNAAAAQQADWASVQVQATDAIARMNSRAGAQMADELAFVAAEKAADARFPS